MAGTIYISPSGNDTNDGLSSASPKKTYGAALSAISDNGTIYCAAGTYLADDEENGYFFHNGILRITVKSLSGKRDVVFMGKDGMDYNFYYYTGSGTDAPLLDIHGIEFNGNTNVKYELVYISNYGTGHHSLIFDNCIFDTGTANCRIFKRTSITQVMGIFQVANSDMYINSANMMDNFGACDSIVLLNNSITFNEGKQTATKTGIAVGTDGPTYTHDDNLNVVIMGNEITYDNAYGGHGILLGRGSDGAVCAFNKVTNTTAGTMIGVVVKADNCDVHHNHFEGDYGLYLKGCKRCRGYNNSFKSVPSSSAGHGLFMLNKWYEDSGVQTIECKYNCIYNNIFDGRLGTYAVKLRDQEDGLTGGIAFDYGLNYVDYNSYFPGSSGLLKDESNGINSAYNTLSALQAEWADPTIWTKAHIFNDANSVENVKYGSGIETAWNTRSTLGPDMALLYRAKC